MTKLGCVPRFTALLALLLTSAACNAGIVVGGSALLTPGYVSQLETWLGQGPVTLTNVFTRHSGDTALEFHAAVDGKGPTFVVLDVSDPDNSVAHVAAAAEPARDRGYICLNR